MNCALIVVLCALLLSCTTGHAAPSLRDGDLVFQTSRSGQSLAIQRATHSPYSHVGVVVHREGRAFVFEASARVRFTPFEDWVKHGKDGHFVVKRLRGAAERWSPDVIAKATALLRSFEGKPYDLAFAWSDERMYCSELVWKVYERGLGVRIGELQKLREFDLSDSVVAAKLRERYGKSVPLDEPVISPASMFASPLLEVVAEQ